MLTIFAVPKPFRGHTGTIQRNAIRSWSRLSPRPEIVLYGDEPGTEEVAREFGFLHVPQTPCTPSGTPLVGPVFAHAAARPGADVLAYVNCDIILTQQLVDAIKAASAVGGTYLMVGRRSNLDVDEELGLANDWEAELARRVAVDGHLERFSAIDYFVFPAGAFPAVPPFAIGRFAWDNWLVGDAWRRGLKVIDATADVLAVHQLHDYSHAGGTVEAAFGAEATANLELARGAPLLTIADATHTLRAGRVRPALDLAHLWRRAFTLHHRHKSAYPLHWVLSGFVKTAKWVTGRSRRGPSTREAPKGARLSRTERNH